ncbi:peptidoglycan-binding protein [Rhodoferax koreense]|uniref:Peptidoglycan-binding protein n=1 Tax=Rhodoferax koreensis TaxID=1842727 RepID=A0A1P8K4P9_9BURK|nr:LysM peptidoglycan-binding domain-containing protein [Rhodoferax koreense]APW40979.1 peptidoglycan-binding protein [Rhodoferax koreense]
MAGTAPVLASRSLLASLALAGIFGVAGAAQAQNYPITASQQATAAQVAQAGVPVADLAPNAPDSYTVKRGDTLWGISGLFLASPWRWPELWGMNLQDIRNPHLIYPGQQLFLDKTNGRATLRSAMAGGQGTPQTVRVSPRTRYESLSDSALPTLQTNLIEPFLAEPIVVDEATLQQAARIVATQEDRVLLSRGDRAYARGSLEAPLSEERGKPRDFRIFRTAVALKDPGTGEILGYEAQYAGKARLAVGESIRVAKEVDKDGKRAVEIVPATIDIVASKEETQVGDQLLPEPPRELLNYVPRAPAQPIDGRIVSVYGSAVANAAQNQIVVINRGTRDGIERGHVLSVLSDGGNMVDRTDPKKPTITLPNERNGLVMVFRPFERVSYALIMEIKNGVKVGDRLGNPR